MRLIDEGIQLEMNLKSMSREELERAYIEAKEIVERMHFGKTLEQKKDEYDGKLTVEKEFDWGEPMGKEIW